MRLGLAIVTICLLIGGTGCSVVPQRYRLAAEPLAQVSEIPPAIITQICPVGRDGTIRANCQFDMVNYLVQDSQAKCADFVDSMFAQTAGSGLILDVLSTGTSAISAIVTPLSTAHALAAASTVLGATKTGISANYLNTLSISHITQAIQSTYTTNMTNYINTLASADKTQIDTYEERSKILSYHTGCSLAAAESSISSTLQAPTTQTQGLSFTHTVTQTETAPAALANALAVQVNAVFGKVGVTAQQDDNQPTVFIWMTNPFKLTVTSTPNGLVAYAEGSGGAPNRLTVAATPKSGNSVTVTGPTAAQAPSTSGQTAAAQPTGQALNKPPK